MKRASIRVQEPTPELIEKIRRARVAISQQKPRYLKCPYCQHNAIATRVKNIRLITDASDGHDIDCKIDGFGAMALKSEMVKKI